MSAHPTYPSPAIVQVTCEIAFSPDSERKLSAAKLFGLLSEEFPELQPIPTTVQLMIGQRQPPEPPQSSNLGAFRFATSDGKRFVQISESNFVYQSNDPYSGWHEFEAKLFDLWKSVSSEIAAKPVVKVGLRYINRIVKSDVFPRIGDWLCPTADLPESLILSEDHFFARVETSPTPANLKLITAASEPPGPDWPLGAIILDIDRVSNELCESDETVLERLRLLHEDIWVAFDSASTPNFKHHLSGK